MCVREPFLFSACYDDHYDLLSDFLIRQRLLILNECYHLDIEKISPRASLNKVFKYQTDFNQFSHEPIVTSTSQLAYLSYIFKESLSCVQFVFIFV